MTAKGQPRGWPFVCGPAVDPGTPGASPDES